MPYEAIRVEGYRELLRNVAAADAGVKKAVRRELADAGESARSEAERLAVENISNVGGRWSRVKAGVTTKQVYIAPATRRGPGSPRPNLGGLLMTKALLPAAERTRDEIVERLDSALDRIADEYF